MKAKITERHHPEAAHYKRSFFVNDASLHAAMCAWCQEQFGPGANDFGQIAPWMSMARHWIAFGDGNLAFALKMRWL